MFYLLHPRLKIPTTIAAHTSSEINIPISRASRHTATFRRSISECF